MTVTDPDQQEGTPVETWLDLEKLAARIYEELEPGCRVQHNVRLRGKLSETDRQIDVLVENDELGTRTVVDCKDWATRANVDDVGKFAALVEDVEATAGVLICNRGFSKSARSYARNKGISLCQVHDVESRKWQLDVRIPLVWCEVTVDNVAIGGIGSFEEGDSLSTEDPPRTFINGELVDMLDAFTRAWNEGAFPTRKSGHWTASTDVEVETLEGARRPFRLDIHILVAARVRLGYVTPAESRGIVDVGSGAYSTVVLDIGRTVDQEPEDGWRESHDIDDLAIDYRGTVVTLDELSDLTIQWTGITSMRYLGPPGTVIHDSPGA